MNKSHIQVNVNKFLEYLRTLGKFNKRYLWFNNEICSGDSFIIWGLLDDIINYYSKINSNIQSGSSNLGFASERQRIISPAYSKDKINYFSLRQNKENENEKSFRKKNNNNNNNNNKNIKNDNSIYSALTSYNNNNNIKFGLKELNIFSPINKNNNNNCEENKFNKYNNNISNNNTNSDYFNYNTNNNNNFSNKHSRTNSKCKF
jgi:hypothetical protein